MKRMTQATLLAGLLVLSLGIGTAAAAPLQNPHAEVITLECGSGEVDVVVTHGNPGHVIGSTQRLIPHEFTFGVAVDGDPIFSETETVGNGAKKGLQDRLITCTAEFIIDDPDALQEFQEFFDEMELDIDVTQVEITSFLEVRAMPTGR